MNSTDSGLRSDSCSASNGVDSQVPSSSCSLALGPVANGDVTSGSTPVHHPSDTDTESRTGESECGTTYDLRACVSSEEFLNIQYSLSGPCGQM